MAINGTVQATGEFAPTSTGDTYAIIDAKYMRDGLRNVDLVADLDNITEDRRIAGMLVGVSGGTIYYKLNPSPWVFNFTDWTEFTTGGGGGVDYWTSGSTGLNSLKTTYGGSDATANNAISAGANNLSSGPYSISMGYHSTASGNYAISMGYYNTSSGDYSLTIGGNTNTADGGRSSIIGGTANVTSISAINSTIGGGQNNIITGSVSFIGNGLGNSATTSYSSVLGGQNNLVSGSKSFIGGGFGNTGSNYYTVIGGGRYNIASGSGTVIGGGNSNIASGNYSSIISGQNNRAQGGGSVVVGGNSNSATTAYSTIGGGRFNHATGPYSNITGGKTNSVAGNYSIIGGGQNNLISGGTHNSVFGGYKNTLSGSRGLILGGGYNTVITQYSAIIGGQHNLVHDYGYYAAVIGGRYNKATKYYSVVVGGFGNSANGVGSVVIGGTGIIGTSDNTVYVPSFNINSSLLNDDALTQVLVRASDGTIKYKASSSFTFTGNTSGTCIANLYVTDIYGCSPVTIHGSTAGSGNSSFKVRNSTTETTSIRDDGYTELDKLGVGLIMGDQSNNYLLHFQNRLEQFSNYATYTGFHANRNGSGISIRATSANDISLVESTGTMTFSTNWDNNFNDTGSLAMLINGENQYVGIGMANNLTVPDAKLHVRGTGNTNSSSAFLVENVDGTDLIRTTNDGLSMFKTTNPTSIFGGTIQTIHAEATVTDPTVYASTLAATTTYNPSGNATGYVRNFSSNIIKYGVYNAPYIAANTSYARNDSTSGTTTDVIAYDAVAFSNDSGTTTNLFSFQGNTQVQNGGTVTNHGGMKLTFGANLAGTNITNMYGILISTPQNTGGAVTNTYGVHIQSNTLGSTANWGLYQDGTAVNNYLGGNTAIGNTTTPTDTLHVNGVTGSTQFRLEKSYTPTGSGDTAGNVGSIAWDDTYFYTKTNTGWGRVALSYAF